MNSDYKWADNQIKLQRAIAASNSKSDAEVKALYLSFGGKIRSGYETPEKILSKPVKEEFEIVEEVEEAPKKKVAKKK